MSRAAQTAGASATEAERTRFDDVVRRYRRELHVYCYRVLGSFEEAEDHVQEVLLRAWRAWPDFQGRGARTAGGAVQVDRLAGLPGHCRGVQHLARAALG
jgi:hypothetical protein